MEQLRQWTDNEMFKSHQLVRAYYHREDFDNMTMHTHNFYELNIVMSGNGKHFLNNSTFHITSGDIFIMPPNVSHGYDFDSKTYSIFHLLFNKQFFVKYETLLNNLTGYQILFNIDPHIRRQDSLVNNFLHINITENYNLVRIFDELVSLRKEKKENTESKKEYLTLYVIAKLCEMIEEEKIAYSGNNRYLFDLLKSVEYIYSNFGSKIELETLYSISCMSRSSYLRYFKKIFNSTPIDFIRDYRLRQAKSMLKHTNNSLTQIASDCGFCDSAHFSRLFKEKYQVSPLKYRTLLKSDSK